MTQVDNIRELLESSPTGQHLLLGEFVLPFAPGEDDPTGVTSSVTDGRAQLWIDPTDNGLRLSVFSKTLGEWATFSATSAEPVGTIKMFYGAASAIPAGWHICDGSNGTPDLSGSFILASDSFDDVGETVAEQSTVIANHQSTLDTMTDDGTSQSAVIVTVDSHTVTTDYFPPYFKLAFIMRVS